jgi:hypothetical protein
MWLTGGTHSFVPGIQCTGASSATSHLPAASLLSLAPYLAQSCVSSMGPDLLGNRLDLLHQLRVVVPSQSMDVSASQSE